MEFKRTTEIFVETNRRFVIRQAEESAQQIACPNCAEPMLAPEQIVQILGISQRRIFQLVETGAAHFVETNTGAMMICPSSVAETLANGKEFLGEK
jgi:hypothetical protein